MIYEFIKTFKSLIREELPSKNTDELLQKMNTLKNQLDDQYQSSVYRANQLIEDCNNIRDGVDINPVLYHTAVSLDLSEDIDTICIQKSMGLYNGRNFTIFVAPSCDAIYNALKLLSPS